MPKKNTKEERKLNQLMKDSASKQKIEWIFVNRIVYAIVGFFIAFILCLQLHKIAIDAVYTEPVGDFDIVGQMSSQDEKRGMLITENDNKYLKEYKGKNSVTVNTLLKDINRDKFYTDKAEEVKQEAAQRIYDKLQIVNSEYLQWYEILIAMIAALVGFYVPIALLHFQKRMRDLEMEDEVMQFQTIIMMLMKIERVNVEIILEWMERYSNIFREPISKCVNNYESGAWEALEQLKNDVSYMPFIRIVESLQAAVEKIPIADAFDELDTERAYYQEKRKDSNERLIAKKGMIGKAIGFAPMIILFVGYLIIPLVFVGMFGMMDSFSNMTTMI